MGGPAGAFLAPAGRGPPSGTNVGRETLRPSWRLTQTRRTRALPSQHTNRPSPRFFPASARSPVGARNHSRRRRTSSPSLASRWPRPRGKDPRAGGDARRNGRGCSAPRPPAEAITSSGRIRNAESVEQQGHGPTGWVGLHRKARQMGQPVCRRASTARVQRSSRNIGHTCSAMRRSWRRLRSCAAKIWCAGVRRALATATCCSRWRTKAFDQCAPLRAAVHAPARNLRRPM